MKTEIGNGLNRCSSRTRRTPGAVWLCGLLVFVAFQAGAVGFRLPNQDPFAIARGNAFVATADNPSAIYYNPAGITQLEGQNFSYGLYLVSAGDTFTSTGGAKAETDAMFQAVPQAYYTYALKDSPFTFGVGLYVPYGLSLDWGYDPPFRNVAQYGSLLYVTVNPVVAWKVTPELSLAVGPTINYSKASLSQGIGITAGDQFHFVGDAVDFGFNAGLLYKPHEKWAFGLNYHSPTTLDYKGHSDTTPSPPLSPSQETHGSLRFPQYVVAGISFRPTTNWNIEFDYDWTDWDNVNEINFMGTSLTPPGTPLVFPLHYRSSSMYEIGVTRYLENGWHVSAGYFYSENSIPDPYFNPIIPDSVLHLVSAGFGHNGERWNWAFSYTLAVNPGRDVNSSVFGPTVNGTYRTVNNALNFSIGLKF